MGPSADVMPTSNAYKTKTTAKTCLWLPFLCNSAGLAVHRPVVWSNQRDKLNFRKVVLHTTDLLPPHYES